MTMVDLDKIKREFFDDIDISRFNIINEQNRKILLFDNSSSEIFPFGNSFNALFWRNLYCHAIRKGYNVLLLGVDRNHKAAQSVKLYDSLLDTYYGKSFPDMKYDGYFFFGTDKESESKYENLEEYFQIQSHSFFFDRPTFVHVNFHVPTDDTKRMLSAKLRYQIIRQQHADRFLYFGSFYDRNTT